MRKINFKYSGFSVPELMIAAGISVFIVGGSAYTFKRFYQTQKQESMKSKSVEGITLAKQLISKDLSSALKILGASGAIFKAVSRPYNETTGAESTYDPSQNDSLVIMKELFADLIGDIEIEKFGPTSINDYSVYYKKDGSSKDTYFLKAFGSKNYFIITNAENRNVFKRSGAVSANIKCPSDDSGTTNCHGIRLQVGSTSGPLIMKDNEITRIGSQLRVAEKVEYFVSSGALYRRIDDETSASKWKLMLPDVQSFQVNYDFKPIEGTGRKSTVELKATSLGANLSRRIRSPKDSTYVSVLTAAGASTKAVTFEDVDRVEIKLTQYIRALDPKLVNVSGNTGFSIVSNVVAFSSVLDQRPGDNTGTDQLDAGIIIGVCDIPEKARCNPSCNYKYMTNEKEYHSDSNLCKCGWDPVAQQYYDPRKFHKTKLPKLYNGLIPAGATLKNNDRIDACASYYDCLGADSWVGTYHPGCYVVNNCINELSENTPTVYSQLYSRPVAYETLAEGGIKFDVLKSFIEASNSNNANVSANQKIRCGGNGGRPYVSVCDAQYQKFATGVSKSVGKTYADVCSCAVREWSAKGSGAAGPRDAHDINWRKICSTVPGNRCDNTWNSTAGQEGFKLRGPGNSQGLTFTMAGLCSCGNLVAAPRTGTGEDATWGPQNIFFFRDFRAPGPSTFVPGSAPALPNEIALDLTGSPWNTTAPLGDLATNCMTNGSGQIPWTCGSKSVYVIPEQTTLDNAAPALNSFEVDAGRRVIVASSSVVNAWDPVTSTLRSLAGIQCVDAETQFIDERGGLGNDVYDAPSLCTPEGQKNPVAIYPPGFQAAGITLAILGSDLWPYRFYCHPDCGTGAPHRDPSRFKVTALIKERDYYRKKMLAKGVPPAACQNQATAVNPPQGGGTITYTEILKSLGSP